MQYGSTQDRRLYVGRQFILGRPDMSVGSRDRNGLLSAVPVRLVLSIALGDLCRTGRLKRGREVFEVAISGDPCVKGKRRQFRTSAIAIPDSPATV